MSSKINIYLDLAENDLKDEICKRLSEDWSISWNIIRKVTSDISPELTAFVVTDDLSQLDDFHSKTIIIFIGDSEGKAFIDLVSATAEVLFSEIKRAFAYRETLLQNLDSLYPTIGKRDSIEAVSSFLKARVAHLTKQTEMRMALVDQLPIGVVGIDDENNVVLMNSKSIETLGLSGAPSYGCSISKMISEEVGNFVCNNEDVEVLVRINGSDMILRKAPFVLDSQFAGTILVIWKVKDI